MNSFQRLLLCIPLFAGLNLISGCASVRSATTQVAVSGRIVDAQGHGVAGEPVEVTLPAAYGLAGRDAVSGKPESYGHQTQRATLRTDADGKFLCIFAATTYSTHSWILPPIGTFPHEPPRPFIALRMLNRSLDVITAGMEDGRFDYRVWDHATGKFRQDTPSRLTGSYTFLKSEKTPDGHRTIPGWRMDLTLIEP